MKNHGHSVPFFERGDNEIYLYTKLTELNLEIWIYQDELEFNSPDLYRHYEKQDWPDPDEMMGSFIKELNVALAAFTA